MYIILKKLFPLIILLAIFLNANDNISQNKTSLKKQTHLDITLSLISSMSETVHSLQQERGASCGYISSNGTKFQKKLESIKIKNDIQINQLHKLLDNNYNMLEKYLSSKEHNALDKTFEELYITRKNVKDLQIDFSKTYSKYTQSIAFMLLQISNISDMLENKELNDSLYIYSTLLMHKESIGQKRAALSALFSKKNFSKEIFEYFLTSDTQEKIYLKSFLHSVDKINKDLYINTLEHKSVQTVKDYEKLALDKLAGKSVDVDPQVWFANVTKKINLIQDVEHKLFENIQMLVYKINTNSFIILTKEEKQWIEDNPMIKIAVMNYWKQDSNGNSMHTDVLKLLNKYGNTNLVAAKYDAWKDGFNDASDGQHIHGIMNLSWSKHREEKYFNYTKAYNYSPNYLIVRKDNNDIKSLSDLKNKTIYLKEKAITQKIIHRASKDIKVINLKTDNEMYIALSTNKDVDAFLSYTVNDIDLEKYNLKIAKTLYDKTGEVALGINKKYPQLALIIDKIYKSIPKEELEKLRSKIYLKNNSLVNLTQEEKKWIQTHTVKVGVEQWAPVVFSNNGKDIDGICGDFTKKIIEVTNLKVEIVNDKWDKLLKDFKNKKLDLLPATYYTDKRAKFGLYSDDYFAMKDYIYIKDTTTNINSMEDLNGKTLAIPKGYGTIDKIEKKFPNIKIVLTKDLDDSIFKVLNGKVDALYDGQITVEKKINDELISGLKGIAQNSFKAAKLHYFSKIDEPILKSILQKGLKSITIEDKKKILSKWIHNTTKNKIVKSPQVSFIGLMSIEELLFFVFLFIVISYIIFTQYSKSNILNIKLKTFNIVIIVFELAVILFMVFEIIILDRTENALAKAHANKFAMIQAADKLRQSSDDLTHFARTYAVTNNKLFKRQYQDTLQIRNGQMARPKGYNEIYWDLDKDTREVKHPLESKKSLKDIIKNLPFTKDEIDKLKQSENNSNDLVSLENRAFMAIKHNDNNLAIQLLHTADYYKAKHKIMLPIDDMMLMLHNRTNNEILILNSTIKIQFRYILIVGLLFILGNIFIYILLRKKVNNPVNYLTNVIKQFKNGNKDVLKKTFYDDEIGEMNKEFFSMQKSIDESNSSLHSSQERLSTLFDASPDSISILDANGNYVDCNKASLKMFGLSSKEEFLQLKPSELSPQLQYNKQLSSQLAPKEIAIAFEKGINKFQWQHKKVDTGELFDAEIVLSYVSLNNKPHIYGIVRDITETKKAQKELKEIQDKQKSIIENKVKELTLKQSKQLETIERSNNLLSGRENKMVELKGEINEYALKLGLEKPYVIVDATESNLLTQSEDIKKVTDITNLLDIPKLQSLMEDFYRFMNIPLAIIDLKANILVQSKWSRACTDFHRANSESCKRCIESDVDISHKLEDGKDFSVYKCKNGLIDCASPIIINGEHLANFFIGQFLIEEPDIEFFTNQAKLFGYDVDDYISAIRDAVVVSEDRLPHILGFLKEITEIISNLSNEKLNFQQQEKNMSMANIASMNLAQDALKATKEIESYKNHLEDLVNERTQELNDEKNFINTIMDSQENFVITSDGKCLKTANKSFFDFYNIKDTDEFISKFGNCICDTFDLTAPQEYIQKMMGNEKWLDYVYDRPKEIHKARINQNKKDYIFTITSEKLEIKGEELKTAIFTDVTIMEEAQKEIEAIHKHTKESIEYASLIQGALIPKSNILRQFFKDDFVIWYPKDIVGGDIWLFNELRHEDECLLMFIDCTGHGVPGAFVTMIVKAIEREIVSKIKADRYNDIDVSPAWVMAYFNKTMKILLRQETKDSLSNAGWDGGIIYYNKRTQILKFAGAETPLFYTNLDGELQTIKGNRYSVGYKKCAMDYEYKETILEVKEGMKFYCTTDGYLDQNGGEKDFPFGKKRFGNIVKENYKESMSEQQTIFLYEMAEYENMIPNNDRNDDMTVIAFEIDAKSNIHEDKIVEIVNYEGVMTQNVIASCMDNCELKITNMGMMGTVSTITIEYCQNMMNYSKNEDINSRQIVPAGSIEVQYHSNEDVDEYYEIIATNIVSIEDKEKIEPKLLEIKSLDKMGIKKRYRELRKSGQNTHEKGGGIGMYEIAKVSDSIEYEFKAINEDKYYFTMKSNVNIKKIK